MTHKLRPSLYRKLDRLLSQICFYVHNKPYRPGLNLEKLEGEPMISRQTILKELNYIDYLSDLIELPFSTDIFDLNKLNQSLLITRVLSKAYIAIRFIIKEHRINELYCSQWLNLYLVHALRTKGNNDIKSEGTLTELIDNNKRILKTRLRKETINKFVQLVSAQKVPKYINILRVIIVCDGEPMQRNQREISKLLLKDEKMRNKLLYRIRLENGIVEVNLSHIDGDWKPLESMEVQYGLLDIKDHYSFFDFFTSLTMLLSDLCLSRNYLAVDVLNQLISFDICSQIVTGEKYPSQIKEAFAMLLQNLYIDVAPFQRLQIPNYVKVWEHLGDLEQGLSSRRGDGQNLIKYQALKTQLIEYLGQLGAAEFKKLKEANLAYSMISLLKKMIEVGLISHEDIQKIFQISKSILKVLIKLLKRRELIPLSLDYETSLKLTETSILLCSLLKLLFLLEMDTKTTKILIQLKNLIELVPDEEKLQLKNYYEELGISEKNKQLSRRLSVLRRDPAQELLEKYHKKMDAVLAEVLTKDYTWELNDNKEILAILMSLSILKVDNEELTKNSVETLYMIHSQTFLIKDCITSMQLVGKNTEKDYFEVMRLSKELYKLAESVEKWFIQNTEHHRKNLRLLLKELKHYLLGQAGSSPPNFVPEPEVEDSLLEEEAEVAGLAQPQVHGVFQDQIVRRFHKTSSYYQNLYRNNDVIHSLIEILKCDLIYRDYITDYSKHQELINEIYSMLALIALDNDQNKKLLMTYIGDVFFTHLKFEQKLHLAPFFSALLSRNPEALIDPLAATDLIDRLFKKIDSTGTKNPTKAYYLDVIAKLVETDSFRNSNISKIVLNKLFEKRLTNTAFSMDKEIIEELSKEMNSRSPQLIFGNQKGVFANPELCYVLSYLNLLTICSGGKNSFAENISQNLVSLTDIKEVLQIELPPRVLYEVLDFLYDVYLETERENFFHFQQIVIELILTLTEKFVQLLDQNQQFSAINNSFVVTHSDCLSMSQIKINCLLKLIESFKNIVQKNIQITSQSKGYKDYSYFLEKCLEYVQKYSNHMIEDIRTNLYELKNCIRDYSGKVILEELELKNSSLFRDVGVDHGQLEMNSLLKRSMSRKESKIPEIEQSSIDNIAHQDRGTDIGIVEKYFFFNFKVYEGISQQQGISE